MARDQFYRGTCEADLICTEAGFSPTQAKPCSAGFVCDEETSSAKARDYPRPPGYESALAVTPDISLLAPGGQLRKLCNEGHFCDVGGDGIPYSGICPPDHWCPTGTGNPLIGLLANDGLLRGTTDGNSTGSHHLYFRGGELYDILGSATNDCFATALPPLSERYISTTVFNHSHVNPLEYLASRRNFPTTVDRSRPFEERCSRDNKVGFVEDAMRMKNCDCRAQFFTLAAVYRFWKCNADEPLEPLGFAIAAKPLSGGRGERDFWYPETRIHKDYELAVAADPAMEPFGLKYGGGSVCKFVDAVDSLSLTKGRLPSESVSSSSRLLEESSNYLDYEGKPLPIRFASEDVRKYESYSSLKSDVMVEFRSELEQIDQGVRASIDPHVFDLQVAVQLIERHGQKLEDMAFLKRTDAASATSVELNMRTYDFGAPLHWCECRDLLRCPNATTATEGSTALADCISTKKEVLQRISLLPLPKGSNSTPAPSTLEGTVDESEILELGTFDVGIITVDQTSLPRNLTYGEHYRISVYDGCKPCPLRYQCESQGDSCLHPSDDRQFEILNQCLKEHRKPVCFGADGSEKDASHCSESSKLGKDFILFTEPDIEYCLSRPYFCSEHEWNYRSFRRLCQDTDEDGRKSSVYDCIDVLKWQEYSKWRDRVCCSGIPELRGVVADPCRSNECSDNSEAGNIIRGTLLGVFEAEFGFVPPIERPLGQFLMNASAQEDITHASPLELFHEWQHSFQGEAEGSVPLHNKFKPELSNTWTSSVGCCRCQRHPMPAYFERNMPLSGFPDDKHQPVQLAITAIDDVELTVAVELLHGAYYSELGDFFGGRDKTLLRVHTPSRFDTSYEKATWLSMIEYDSFDQLELDLPLNLPQRSSSPNHVEAGFIVDRPSNVSIGDSRAVQAPYLRPRSDPVGSVMRGDDWWQDRDFLAMPYLPFFSNCDGYDSHMSLSRLLEEHPGCDQVKEDDTIPTREYNGREPLSDACREVSLTCVFEEEVSMARKKLRWFEADPGSTLFYIVSATIGDCKVCPACTLI